MRLVKTEFALLSTKRGDAGYCNLFASLVTRRSRTRSCDSLPTRLNCACLTC